MTGRPDEGVPTPSPGPETGTTDRSPPAARTSVPLGDRLVLASLLASFVLVFTYLGYLRFANFYTANWDLGINQQMLWTAAHGRLLYETGDAQFYNVHSFLQVHSTYVAFLLVPLYAALPYPTTLFAVQAGAFVASILPLYLICRRVVASRSLVFLVIGLYLGSFAVISGLLYDFHWESFLPLEFLTFFYLYRTGRRAYSLVPLSLGVLTLEVFPFLIVGAGLLVAVERLERIGPHVRALYRDHEVRLAALLVVGMGIAYLGVRLAQYTVVPALAGFPATSGQLSGGITSPFAISATRNSLSLSTNYWLLLLASFALLPLLAPRYLLLSVPWFVYSFFLSPFYSSQFGNQYALVAVAPLAVALVYGVARLERLALDQRSHRALSIALLATGVLLLVAAVGWSRPLLSRSVPLGLRALLVALPVTVVILAWFSPLRRGEVPSTAPPRRRPAWNRPRAQVTLAGAILAAFLGFNLVMSPINTANFQATQYPGYWLSYSTNPAEGDMGWLTGKIPANSLVLASDFLFPYVANNPNAWAIPWFPFTSAQAPPYFPFSATYLPTYVLIDGSDWTNLPCVIAADLLNSSIYGLKAYVYSTGYLGTISLYELGYAGVPDARYVSTPPPVRYYTASNLSLGPSGATESDSQAKFGVAINSTPISYPISPAPPLRSINFCVAINAPAIATPGPTRSLIWYGPYVSLPAGTYVITANISAQLAPGANLSDPILTMAGGPYFIPNLYNFSLTAADFRGSGWTNITWSLSLPTPYPLMEFEGYLDYSNGSANGSVTLNYIEVRA